VEQLCAEAVNAVLVLGEISALRAINCACWLQLITGIFMLSSRPILT
jgi:hypothetical protein